MPYLIAASLIFALSPGLIGTRLQGVDSAFVTAARLGLALLVFAPFLRLRGLSVRLVGALLGIGAVQFGLMYLAYIESFRFLPTHQVALFTITTPILVTLFADSLDRILRPRALLAALLAVLGAGVIHFRAGALDATLAGFGLLQLSNLAFAIGQVWYQRLRARHTKLRDRDVFGLLYAGGFTVAVVVVVSSNAIVTLTGAHLATLAYLGVVASGIGFFLWNVGATKVGVATLGVMNNLKIPLMIAASLIVFGERADVLRLVASFAIMAAAVWLAETSGGRR
jgi:drug/metabolite transporter (DMT)-like permease